MATTNLVTKSLGKVYIQSGNGIPNHTAPKGSIYSNIDTGTLWINVNNTNTWSSLQSSAYGAIYLKYDVDATITKYYTQEIPSPVANVWYNTKQLNWLILDENGVVRNNGSLQILPNFTGTYYVQAKATFKYKSASVSNYLGLAKNDSIIRKERVYVSLTNSNIECVSLNAILKLNAGDYLNLNVQSTGTANIVLPYAMLAIKKISD